MDEFARKPNDERLAFINEAANRRGLAPIIIEKDFWVCWTLKRLSANPDLVKHLTFKGGTSLSKAYGIIERFSEDIDLTISRDAPLICDVSSPMDGDISGNERQRRIAALKTAAQNYVQTIILPALERAIADNLGTRDGWELVLDPDDPDKQTILFGYPKLLNYGQGFGSGRFGVGAYGEGEYGYIRPRIKLEFGARGETDPHAVKTITPYLADEFPNELVDAAFTFPTLAAERTFWEKITILHALHHGSKLRDGMSRHYYDSHMLFEKGVADTALADTALLAQVVRNKSLMFQDSKASYDTAVTGTLRLVPPNDIRAQLKGDYAAMSEMFMGKAPDFETLMRSIAALEDAINR
jgi:Nucleotidyl transferase AbiEii toxin, Type IV TA system